MIAQIAIFVLGVTGIGLSQVKRTAKYGCIVSLTAQPFWLYAAYEAKQWGIFAACFVYIGVWSLGVYTYWIKEALSNDPNSN